MIHSYQLDSLTNESLWKNHGFNISALLSASKTTILVRSAFTTNKIIDTYEQLRCNPTSNSPDTPRRLLIVTGFTLWRNLRQEEIPDVTIDYHLRRIKRDAGVSSAGRAGGGWKKLAYYISAQNMRNTFRPLRPQFGVL